MNRTKLDYVKGGKSVIEVKDLKVHYKNHKTYERALGPIQLTIEKGDIIAIIGPSGCGKSTFIKALAGVTPYEGSVLMNDEQLSYQKQRIGYIPQGYGLLPWKTVYDNCLLPFRIKKMKLSPEKKKHLEEVLKTLELSHLVKRYPSSLSGGQRQRVALARAFAMSPELLLMDEPFSALDAIMKEEAIQTFLKIWKVHHCTTLIVTHSIEEALYMGNKILVMDQKGTVSAMWENPLFGDNHFRDSEHFKALYHQIKGHIKRGRS